MNRIITTFVFVCAATGLLHAQDLTVRTIDRTNDITETKTKDAVTWYQGEKVIYNLRVLSGTNSVYIPANSVAIWYATDATLTNYYLWLTGAVVNASEGRVIFTNNQQQSALPVNVYESAVVIYDGTPNSDPPRVVADRTQNKVLWSPHYTGIYVGPIDDLDEYPLDATTVVLSTFWSQYADDITDTLGIDTAAFNALDENNLMTSNELARLRTDHTTTSNKANTAYGWGNHSSAGYGSASDINNLEWEIGNEEDQRVAADQALTTSVNNKLNKYEADSTDYLLTQNAGIKIRTNLFYSAVSEVDGSDAIFMNRSAPAGTPFSYDLWLNTALSVNGLATVVGSSYISMKESSGTSVYRMEKNADEIKFVLNNASDGQPRDSAVFTFQNEIRVKDSAGTTYMSITPDEVKVGQNSFTMYASGDIEQDSTNTATLGIGSFVSLSINDGRVIDDSDDIASVTAMHTTNTAQDAVIASKAIASEVAATDAAIGLMITNETTSRIAADAALSNAVQLVNTNSGALITNEATARIAADASLSNALALITGIGITNETAARIAADASLSNGVASATSNNEATSNHFATAFGAEQTARAGADASLTNLLDGVISDMADITSDVSNIDTRLTATSNTLYAIATNKAGASYLGNMPAMFLPVGSISFPNSGRGHNATVHRIDIFGTNTQFAIMGMYVNRGTNMLDDFGYAGLELWQYTTSITSTGWAVGARSPAVGGGLHDGAVAQLQYQIFGRANSPTTHEFVVNTRDENGMVEAMRIDHDANMIVSGRVTAAEFVGSFPSTLATDVELYALGTSLSNQSLAIGAGATDLVNTVEADLTALILGSWATGSNGLATAQAATSTAAIAVAGNLASSNHFTLLTDDIITDNTLTSNRFHTVTTNEEAFRINADASLSNAITQAGLDLGEVETNLTDALDAEIALRDGADAALSNGVTTLTANMGATSNGYQVAVSNEAALRIESDASLSNSAVTAASQISMLTGQVAVVITDNNLTSNSLAAAITNETGQRIASDAAQSNNLDTVSGNLGTASNALYAALTNEAAQRVNADAAISNSIDDVVLLTGLNDTNQTAALTNEAALRADADAALSNLLDTVQTNFSNELASVDAATVDGMDASDFNSLLDFQIWQTNVGRRVFLYPTNGQQVGTFNGVAFTNNLGTNFVAYYFENARGFGTGGWIEVQATLK